MATNYVALRITADDSAKPELTELQARLAELKDRVATARAEVDDAQADAVLADLDAKLDLASKKVASPKIDIAGASRAAAQVTAVESELDRLDAKATAQARAAAAAQEDAARQAAEAEIAAYQEAARAQEEAAAQGAAAAKAAADEAAAAAQASAEKSKASWAAIGDKAKMALLGVGIGAAVAVKGASDFQAQTTRLVTSAGESAKNLGQVRQGMLGIAASTGTSTAQMASGMYTVESAGFHGAAALKVLTAASQGAKDEGAGLATVSNAVTDVLVDYHMKASQSAVATSQLVKAVSFGKTNFEEFSGSMSTVLPLASSLHLKLSDVTGVLAEMTAHGVGARQAADDEANAMRELAKPNGAMVKEFKALGISSDQVYAKLGSAGLGGTMQWLSGVAQKGAGHIGQNYVQALGKLMGTAPGLQVALMTTGKNANDTNKAIAGIAGASADAKGNVDGFSTVSGTMAFKLAAAKESIMAAGISLGQVLLPAAAAVLTPLTRMLQAIAGNRAESIAFAVVVGGVLAGALGGKLAKALKDTEEGIKYTGEKAAWLAKKFGLMGDAQAKGAEKGAAATKTASAESAAAAEGAATAEETAAGEAAAAQETAAGEVAAANDTAAAESSSSWAASAVSGIASAAKWAAQGVAKVAVYVATNVAGAATTAGAWVAQQASQLASGAATVAGSIARVAVMVAANVAGAAVTAGAWLVANAVMMLGIGLIIVAVVAAVVLIVKHWKQISDAAKEAFDAVVHAVSVAIDWVKSHWPLLLAILTGPIGLATLWIVKHWRQISKGASDAIHDVTSFFTSLPGRILSAVGDLGRLLWSAGGAVIHGLIGGIESQVGGLISMVTGVGGQIEGALKSALGIASPSKKTYYLGVMTGQGFTEGFTYASQGAYNAAKRVAQNTAILLSENLMAGLTGTASQVNSIITKMLSTVNAQLNAGFISERQASGLTNFLQSDNTRLQALATQRAGIAKTIAAAQKYAITTAQNTESTFSLMNAANTPATSSLPPMQASQIASSLRQDVAQIRTFKSNIAKLSRMGLSRAYINQLIQAGPIDGGQVAAELASGSLTDIRQVNSAESQIAAASTSLGRTASDALYDSGRQAGKGFLSGLQAQQAAIAKMMRKIAAAMVDALKKDLAISSPSQVLRWHGRMAGEGVALGLEDSIARVMQAGRRVAAAVSGVTGSVHAGQPGYGGAGGGVQEFRFVFEGADGKIMSALMGQIRVMGGDPRIFQKKVVFA